MEFTLWVITRYVVLLLSILAFFTFILEKLWIPFRKTRRERIQPPIASTESSDHNLLRDELIARKQEEYNENASEKEKNRLEKEQEKKKWVMEEKIRRMGLDTGEVLGTLEDNELKRRRQMTPLEESRKIREEQDKEYEESLKQDELKERKIMRQHQASITKAKRKEERMKRFEENSPIPPIELNQGVCSIVFRMPNGERVERRFYSNTKLQYLIDFAEAISDIDSINFQLVTNLPRTIYTEREITLENAGFTTKALLIVEEINK